MRKTIHIHIGHFKCGSSAIQDFCEVHRDSLLQNGYYYPPSHGVKQHGLISPSYYKGARENDRSNFYLQQMLNSINESPADHIILSCESFVLDEVEYFDVFKEFEIRFVYYIRPQDQWLESFFNQKIKEGNLSHLYIPLRKDIAPEVDFLGNINKFTSKYGEDAITVRVLDRRVLVDGDLIQDFLYAIGYKPRKELPAVSVSNESLRGDYLRFAAHLTLVPVSRLERMRVVADLTALSEGADKVELLTASEKAEVRRVCREHNKRIAHKYLKDYDQETIASILWGNQNNDDTETAPCTYKIKGLQLPLEKQAKVFSQLSSPNRILINLKSIHTAPLYDAKYGISYAPLPDLPEEKLEYEVRKLTCGQAELDFSISTLIATINEQHAQAQSSYRRRIGTLKKRVIGFLGRKKKALQALIKL